MNIVCFGDSITHAYSFAECDKWPVILQNKLNEWKRGKYKVINRGIGGNTTANGYERFESEILPLMPGVVLIEFGFNDSSVWEWATVPRVGLDEYRKNLLAFHRAIKAKKGRTIFIVNHPTTRSYAIQGNGKSYKTNFKPYNPAVREVAKKTKSPMIDLPAMIRRRKVDLKTFLADDGLHLSVRGNHLYAGMVFDALREIL